MNFREVIDNIERKLREDGHPVLHNNWQSIDVSDKPHMAHIEILNHSFTIELSEDLDDLASKIRPNLPWADNHFEQERVSGEPLNPGTTWKDWPYAQSAKTHQSNEIFDHTYAERYWPKQAGKTRGGKVGYNPSIQTHKGIRYDYGDLSDLIKLLVNDPLTRQAYLPVWFPEDLTASKFGKRVPCSLGYHFINRDNKLHIVYYIRSCDYIRHFRDDVYLTARLLLWVLSQLRSIDSGWDNVEPGTLTMHTTSLHIFKADYPILFP